MTQDLEAGAQAPEGEPGEHQDSFLPPDVPDTHINPPTGGVFANATWLRASADLVRLVQKVLDLEEFEDIRHLPFEVVWRRNTSPHRSDGSMQLAGIWVPEARIHWELHQMEVPDGEFPRYCVDLNWQHFENMRSGKGEDGKRTGENPAEFIHRGILAREIHEALCSLGINNDIIFRIPPDVVARSLTARRFGQYNDGLRNYSHQQKLFEDEHQSGMPPDYLAQD